MNKKILSSAVAGTLLLGAQATQATVTVEVDLDGNGVGPTQMVDVFDWAPGNALAVGAVPITAAGQTFDLLYQAKLGNLQLGGANVSGPTDEFTIVLGISEVVSSVPNALLFSLALMPQGRPTISRYGLAVRRRMIYGGWIQRWYFGDERHYHRFRERFLCHQHHPCGFGSKLARMIGAVSNR